MLLHYDSLSRARDIERFVLAGFDGVLDVLDGAEAAVGIEVDGDEVDAAVFGEFRVLLRVSVRQREQSRGLTTAQALGGGAHCVATTGLHFDEGDDAVALRDDVDLAVARAGVRRDDAIALRLQVGDRTDLRSISNGPPRGRAACISIRSS